ncbi:nucleotidyltransferase domain-containing protein [Sphingomonas koreensis]
MTAAPALLNEFRLVAACCRWPRGDARDAAVRAAAAEAVDWDRVERVTRRHRVSPLVHDGLACAGIALPGAMARALAGIAQQARISALRMAREAALLQEAFDAAACPALFVKGASLAMLAYGDPGLKWGWDIDLLTTAGGAAQGRAILESLGYVLVEPEGLDARKFQLFLALGKECIFVHAETRIAVELHWKLVDNPHLLPGIDALSPSRTVQIGGRELRTLEDSALLAYLLVHGTRHAWSRLKWLADVAALLSRYPPDAIEPLYRDLQALEAGRAAAVGFLLCHDLLGIALPDGLRAELRADRATRRLVATARAALTYGQGEREVSTYSVPGIRTLASHFTVAPGWRPFAWELASKWTCSTDRLALPLPRPLWFLYHVLRVPLWIWRRGGIALRAIRPAAGRAAGTG